MSDTCRYTDKSLDECDCAEGCEPTTLQAGEWTQPIENGYRMVCCDCGLAHLMDFQIKEGKVQFRAFREDGA